MFCPECGTLSFPDSSGNIKCPNYRCDYSGSAENKVTLEDGSNIDLAKVASKTVAASLKHLTEVIDDSQEHKGMLTSKTYVCPKCDSDSVYAELRQTRASDEPETRILTCADCDHGWREY
jgi:DNA-directed RNA polymerase subunit M/transcription elongation factor TFIIS